MENCELGNPKLYIIQNWASLNILLILLRPWCGYFGLPTYLLMNHLIKDKFVSVKEQVTDFPGFQVNIKDFLAPSNAYRNPYDIERKNLLDQVSLL